jgi:hypothetical protein
MGKQTTSWKRDERRVAAAVGGERLGPGTDRADVRAQGLTVEVKRRSSLPKWLTGAVQQARGYASEYDLPIAVIHAAGERIANALVVMRLADFQDWHGALPAGTFTDTDVERAAVGPIPV